MNKIIKEKTSVSNLHFFSFFHFFRWIVTRTKSWGRSSEAYFSVNPSMASLWLCSSKKEYTWTILLCETLSWMLWKESSSVHWNWKDLKEKVHEILSDARSSFIEIFRFSGEWITRKNIENKDTLYYLFLNNLEEFVVVISSKPPWTDLGINAKARNKLTFVKVRR